MRIRITLALTALVVAATGGAVGLTASPANAALSDCPAGYLCAYTNNNYVGTPGKVQFNNANLLQYNTFDNARSIFNNGTQCGVTIWTGLGYSGTSTYLPRGTGYGNLSTQNPPFFRNVASNIWC